MPGGGLDLSWQFQKVCLGSQENLYSFGNQVSTKLCPKISICLELYCWDPQLFRSNKIPCSIILF